MCGIAGFAGLPIDAAGLARMTAAIAHRGPDEEGAHVDPGRCGIGFRRLSIIDLETGSQPLQNETGEVIVTCNGEIYNFRRLREQLRAAGHTFATGSDCEVIAHLYEDHSDDFVDHLQGMFAIALWDARRHRLVLARDRMGVKPLYVAERNGGLVYGSEPSAILASGLIRPHPDPEALFEYLTLQYVQAPRTGFAGIEKLRPGELLTWEAGRTTRRRYWELQHPEAPEPMATGEALERLDTLLRDATDGRLVADVPLGAFLSGGIDSSLVVSYMAERSARVRTFSIDFPVPGFSEASHAERVAQIYGTEHETFLVEPDMVPTVADAVRHLGEPFADSSAIPTYLLSQRTRQHVTVALSGDGGDEAFGGYVRYQVATQAQRFGPILQLAGTLGERLAGRALSGRAPRVARGLDVLSRSPHERYASMMAHFEPRALSALCTPEFLASGDHRYAWDQVLALPPLPAPDRYMALDVRTYLPGDVLTKVDRTSMTHALEVRSPLLDYRVQEFGAALPASLKLRGNRTKWLLRELAARRGLPPDLVHRSKQGFGIPVGEWFRDELGGWLTDVLFDPRTEARGYFRRQEVSRLVDAHLQRRADHTPRLWNLMMLELWHRTWIDGET